MPKNKNIIVGAKFSVCLLITSLVLTYSVIAQEENQSQWPEFSKWYQWKVQSRLNENQKKVVQYLENSTAIYNKAFETETVQAGSPYGYPNPKKAIEIVEQALKEFKRLTYPDECKEYRKSTIELMKYIISYHKLRLTYKEGPKEFDFMHRRLEMAKIKSGYDSKQFSEYFNSLRKAGLFDNIEKEFIELGIIDKKELEDFYGYFQEIDINVLPKCPICSTEMRKVPIIYGKVNKNGIYDKEGKIIALPGVEARNFSERPEFAYICDKDNAWYEEHPSPNKGKVIIRKWGWGLKNRENSGHIPPSQTD